MEGNIPETRPLEATFCALEISMLRVAILLMAAASTVEAWRRAEKFAGLASRNALLVNILYSVLWAKMLSSFSMFQCSESKRCVGDRRREHRPRSRPLIGGEVATVTLCPTGNCFVNKPPSACM